VLDFGHATEISVNAESDRAFPTVGVLPTTLPTAMTNETARNTEDRRNEATDLYCLAFVLAGRQDISIDIAADAAVSGDDEISFFLAWMRSWQQRVVIGRALTAIDDELADSARRTQLLSADGSLTPPRNWSLSPDTAK